jgi:ATP-dependent Lon protease
LRGGIKTVLIPEENAKDLQEIPENVKERPRDRAGALDRQGAGDRPGAHANALPEEEPVAVAAPRCRGKAAVTDSVKH